MSTSTPSTEMFHSTMEWVEVMVQMRVLMGFCLHTNPLSPRQK